MSFTVVNLSTNDEHVYDDKVEKVVAVCQSYCLENNLSSWFFAMLHNNLRFIDSLPLVMGDKSIACGDWTAMLD